MSEIRRRPYGRASTEYFRLRDSAGALVTGGTVSAATVTIDGAAPVSVGTTPTFDATAQMWKWVAAAAELTGKRISFLLTHSTAIAQELRFETEGDASAQYPSDGQFFSTTASGIAVGGCTLGGSPGVLPEGNLTIRYADSSGNTLAEVFCSVSGTSVTHITNLTTAPTTASRVHLFAYPKDTPTATLANTFADAALDRVDGIATGMTPRMYCRLMLQSAGGRGKINGATGSTSAETINVYGPDDTTIILASPTDQYGNRTALATINSTALTYLATNSNW